MATKVRAVQSNVVSQVKAIAPIVATHKTLSDVVAWFSSSGGRFKLADAVAQDEFTRDVIVKCEGNTYLVYDAT